MATKWTSIEAIDPKDVEGKVLIMKTGARHVDAAMATAEILKAFPGIAAHQILIMPDDFQLLSLPRKDLVATLKGYLRRFQSTGDR